MVWCTIAVAWLLWPIYWIRVVGPPTTRPRRPAYFWAWAGGGHSDEVKSGLISPDFTLLVPGSANLCPFHGLSFFGRSQIFDPIMGVGRDRPSLIGGTNRTSNVTSVQPGSDNL